MQDSDGSHDLLLSLLREDIAHAEALLALINEEFRALGERNLSALQAILSSKLPLLNQLEEHDQQRRKTWPELFPLPAASRETAVGHTKPTSPTIAKDFSQLSDLIRQCQAANLRNGRLIKANHMATRALLSIVRGEHEPSLYDRFGSSGRIGQRHSISEA